MSHESYRTQETRGEHNMFCKSFSCMERVNVVVWCRSLLGHNKMDDIAGEDDLLVLCSLVEEYKESLDHAEARNNSLSEQLERALTENASLREKAEQQNAVIRRLDDSVNQLMEDLEHANSVVAMKDGDLQSLQHCLNVIHRKKVEVDDQTQLEQSKIIANLFAEKSKINEAYSANLKILEEYLDIINSRESEILDLKHIINLLESERGEQVYDLSDEEKDDFAHRPAAKTTPNVTKPVSVHSPPVSAPPAGLVQGTVSAANKLAAVRAASTAVVNAVPLELSSDDEGPAEDEESSPNVPVTISRNRTARLHKHSGGSNGASNNNISSNNTTDTTTAEQKAAALSKYRRYVAQNEANSSNNNAITSANTSTNDLNGWASNSSRATSAASNASSSAESEALKWSDVGKHERLFNKVDIIKNRPVPAHKYPQPRREPKFGDSANDSVNDSMEYEADHPDLRTSNQDLNSSTLSATDSMHSDSHSVNNSLSDSVEVFVQIDSNPSSPERMKPSKPLFKPPFSKPTFNEFTPNTNSARNSSGGASNKTSTKSSFDAYSNKKGANYAAEKTVDADMSNTLDAKNVSWADSKRERSLPHTASYTAPQATHNDHSVSDSKMSARDDREGTYKRTASAGSGQVPFPSNVQTSQVPASGGMNMGAFLYRRSGDSASASTGGNTSRSGENALFKKRTSNTDGNSSPNYTRL